MTEELTAHATGVEMDRFLDELHELVELDTVSPLDERQLGRAEQLLGGYGCARLGEQLFARGNPDSATWVYCHLDTKPPVPREAWATDPFRLTRIDDRLYGLGVSDAKFQLLNALHATPETSFLLVDTAEECGGPSAPELMSERELDTLVVVDGAVGAVDVYNGLSGQVDGVLVLSTGRASLHPGRERTGVEDAAPDILELLARLHEEVASRRWRLNVTGVSAPVTERSVTLERLEVRFDLRFGASDIGAVCQFLDRHDCRTRQFMDPVEGRERFEAASFASGGRAPFSSNLGRHGVIPRRVVIVPGARNDNGAHQPNEFVHTDQLEPHRARLAAVLAALQEEPDA